MSPVWLGATEMEAFLSPARDSVLSSNPKFCAIDLIFSAPSFTPSWAKAVLQETVSAWIKVMLGCGQVPAPALWMVKPPPAIGVYELPAGITVCGLYPPSVSAAAETITFMVDPGGYVSWIARFSSGWFGSLLSLSYAFVATSASWLASGPGS